MTAGSLADGRPTPWWCRRCTEPRWTRCLQVLASACCDSARCTTPAGRDENGPIVSPSVETERLRQATTDAWFKDSANDIATNCIVSACSAAPDSPPPPPPRMSYPELDCARKRRQHQQPRARTAAPVSPPPLPSRRRDCHFDDAPCLSLLKHLMKVQGGAIK